MRIKYSHLSHKSQDFTTERKRQKQTTAKEQLEFKKSTERWFSKVTFISLEKAHVVFQTVPASVHLVILQANEQ